MQTKQIYINQYITIFIKFGFITWAILLFLTAIGVNKHNIETITATIELFVHTVIIYITLLNYRSSMPNKDKTMFALLLFASICLFVNDFSFYIIMYLLKNTVSKLWYITFYIPMYLWLFLCIIFLFKLLFKNFLNIQNKEFASKIILTLISTDLIILFIFASSTIWKVDILSMTGLRELTKAFFAFLLFDLAILSLCLSNKIGLRVFLTGIIVLIAGDFWITYSFIINIFNIAVYGELYWLLGLLIMLTGVQLIYKNNDLYPEEWLDTINSMKSRLVFWVLCISIISFLAFFGFVFLFSIIDRSYFSSLPFFIMIYSILVVLLSLTFSKKFVQPFIQIRHNMEKMMLNDSNFEINTTFSIDEFIVLQKHFEHIVTIRSEHDKVKDDFSKIAAQVSHDLRSPLNFLEFWFKKIKNQTSENDYKELNRQLYQIRKISQDLLDYRRNSLGDLHDRSSKVYIEVYGVLQDLIWQKELEWGQQCKINFIHGKYSRLFYINTEVYQFKTMLSNLLNNSYEAMSGNKVPIEIRIEDLGSIFRIIINDQGIGIPKEEINNIINGKSLKKIGNGLGLSSAINYVKGLGGTLEIESIENTGTKVSISFFEAIDKPAWCPSFITIPCNHTIVIVDDDTKIHDFWHTQLSNKKINVKNFLDSKSFINWYKMNPHDNIIVFMDYDLGDKTTNGLEVLINLQISYAYLITGMSEELHIQNKIANLPYFLIAKSSLSNNFQLRFNE